jgi:hypothetical protein
MIDAAFEARRASKSVAASERGSLRLTQSRQPSHHASYDHLPYTAEAHVWRDPEKADAS